MTVLLIGIHIANGYLILAPWLASLFLSDDWVGEPALLGYRPL